MENRFRFILAFAVALVLFLSLQADLLAQEWPSGHPENAVSAVITNSAMDGDSYILYVWRENGHVWFEVEPLTFGVFVCGPYYIVIQNGVQLPAVPFLLRNDGEYHCGDLYVTDVFLLAEVVACCYEYDDYVKDPQAFTLIVSLPLDVYVLEIPAEGEDQAPEADFIAEPTNGTAPLTISFTDQSTGDLTSWSWNFGDGVTSTDQNPTYTYNDPGTYTVSLTVTGPGGTDTETKTDYITVTASLPDVSVTLIPDDTVIPRGGTLGVDVTITNNTDEAQIIYFATNVTLPNGNIYPPFGYLFGPYRVTLDPYQSKSGHLSHTIPGNAPIGAYTYHGYVGKPSVGIIDEDQFDFEVIGPKQAIGPEDWDTTVDKAFTE